ncbi:hypothetical protein [Thermococcus pacificus]|uniref:Uncharacterized protein n=1 Tax=Thermococcus pacificus TaxID=71998 RepID=A0A218P9M9_9EURY|nr:hypothetical protein [Thermococcus pacificus]ASJ07478.1 hypothetical protein A3L08_09180 [Thermococcus pacificus]
MKVRLGYPDRIVEVDGEAVYVFRGRLVSAPLKEVVRYYRGEDALLPPAIREISRDVVAAILRTSALQNEPSAALQALHSISG